MAKKLLDVLMPEGNTDKLNFIEGKRFDFEIDCDFEGGATCFAKGRIIKNARGNYVLKEGKRHTLNISKYLKGIISSVHEIRIYEN